MTFLTLLRRLLVVAALLLTPSIALGAANASFGGFFPPDGKAGVGTRVTFTVIPSGFTNPTYYLVDSFPGGAGTRNIDSQGNFSWTPNHDDIGLHTFTITVSDAQGNSVTISANYEVVNPQVTTSTISPGTTVTYGTPISFTLSSLGFLSPIYEVEDEFFNSSVVSYNLIGTTFTWTPQLRDIGVHNLRVTARDNTGHYASTTKTVTVFGLPAVSVAGLSPGTTVGVGQTLTFSATSTGIVNPVFEIEDLFYRNRPASSTMSVVNGAVRWTPVYNDVGVHTFAIVAKGDENRTASTELRVTVSPTAVQMPTTSTPSAPTVAPTTTNTAAAPSVKGYVFTTYLAVGSSGTAVTELQKKLTALKLYSGPITGYFGNLTKVAVQAFQKSAGLEQVGYIGPGTRAALNK